MDDILREHFQFNRKQKVLIMVCFVADMLLAQQVGVLVFIADKPTWHCESIAAPVLAGHGHGSNVKSRYKLNHDVGKSNVLPDAGDKCLQLASGACKPSFVDMRSLATAEFSLVCEKEGVAAYAQSLYFIGMLLGSAVGGWATDRYGRRHAMISGAALTTAASLWSGVAQSFWSLALSRLVAGLGGMWCTMASMVYASEIVAPSYRGFVTSLISVSLSIGVSLASPVAYIFQDSWRDVMLAMTALAAFSTFLLWMFLCESPRWCFTHGRHDDLEDLLINWASSGSQKQQALAMLQTAIKASHEELSPAIGSSSKESTITLSALFTGRFRKKLFPLLWTWASVCLVAYSLSLKIDGLGDKYISFFLLAVAGVPSNFGIIRCLHYIGRKACLMWLLALVAFFTGLCVLNKLEWFTTHLSHTLGSAQATASGGSGSYINWLLVFSVLARFSISSAYSVLYTYTPELFPTAVRSKGLGACTLVSRFGAIASPFFLGLSAIHPAWPYVVFFISSITACMCMHRMPETRDRDLPESLQDVYQLIADS
ncbi:solute carrier family 22 member 15-like [Sycon ciliatum]|uniref:solute carrier family 22 member 15-like n=1 Tax=Sycon ciliatum TaxID=27933 RepID=UPI0031F618AF